MKRVSYYDTGRMGRETGFGRSFTEPLARYVSGFELTDSDVNQDSIFARCFSAEEPAQRQGATRASNVIYIADHNTGSRRSSNLEVDK